MFKNSEQMVALLTEAAAEEETQTFMEELSFSAHNRKRQWPLLPSDITSPIFLNSSSSRILSFHLWLSIRHYSTLPKNFNTTYFTCISTNSLNHIKYRMDGRRADLTQIDVLAGISALKTVVGHCKNALYGRKPSTHDCENRSGRRN